MTIRPAFMHCRRHKRNKFLSVLFSAALMLTATACGPRISLPDIPEATTQEDNEAATMTNETSATEPYRIPDGWVKVDAYSSADKVFYVEAGHENDRQPDNFSVEYGTNRYAADEHEQFRDAIMQQLTVQASQYNASLTASGTTTDAGDMLYIFTTDYGDSVGTQYYVVGEKEYCFFYATDFTGASVAADAALATAKSFSW